MLVKFTVSEVFYEAFGVVVSVAFRVFVVFMGHFMGPLWLFTALVRFMGIWG